MQRNRTKKLRPNVLVQEYCFNAMQFRVIYAAKCTLNEFEINEQII